MTAQVDEILLFNGNKTSITFHSPLPNSHPGIIKVDNKDSKNVDPVIGSTACWRGYTDIWEIQNDQLYLIDIVGCYQMIDTNPIFADWVSGLMHVPQGKLVYCDRSGAKVYEIAKFTANIQVGLITHDMDSLAISQKLCLARIVQ
ncbi:hypothetical protein ACQ4M4_04640 [Leptolyngbya sp. AN02str]|uniref:hypothetical protein n=1 Tax=Leptolyngbya sp. AN02str TaxID=3423363 RepID=UPI003D31F5E4